MNRSYHTFSEQEAYHNGRQDVSNHRRDYEHDRYSNDASDQAYWQGRVDEEREIRIRQEEREREEYEEMMMRQHEEERRREEEYNLYLQEERRHDEEEYEKYLQAQWEAQMREEYPEPPIDELQPDELTPEEMREISKQQFFLNVDDNSNID